MVLKIYALCSLPFLDFKLDFKDQNFITIHHWQLVMQIQLSKSATNGKLSGKIRLKWFSSVKELIRAKESDFSTKLIKLSTFTFQLTESS